jgi:predicted enzyme related to lactoylglutathione lyase
LSVLINIDVPDLERALAFYMQAFGLTVRRRLGEGGAELAGWPAPVFLLRKEAGSIGAGEHRRDYKRHWTPVHLDVVVDDMEKALSRTLEAGALLEQGVRTAAWGKIAMLADPFGHGLCLIQFLNRGYDEIAEPGGN